MASVSEQIGVATPQQIMRIKLESIGLPHKNVRVYGRQIVVTCWSRAAAGEWSSLIARFAKIRGVFEGVDETQDTSRHFRANPGLVKSFFSHKVWRVYASV